MGESCPGWGAEVGIVSLIDRNRVTATVIMTVTPTVTVRYMMPVVSCGTFFMSSRCSIVRFFADRAQCTPYCTKQRSC